MTEDKAVINLNTDEVKVNVSSFDEWFKTKYPEEYTKFDKLRNIDPLAIIKNPSLFKRINQLTTEWMKEAHK